MRPYKIAIVLVGLLAAQSVLAQKQDSKQRQYHFLGAISLTNNGISLVPTFSLGKPATLFNLSLGGESLTLF